MSTDVTSSEQVEKRDPATPLNAREIHEFANGLWKLSQFLGAHADELADGRMISGFDTVDLSVYCYGESHMVDRRKAIGGRWAKKLTEYSFDLVKEFGEFVSFRLHASRSAVCERVEVGTEVVEVIDPDYERPEPPKVKREQPVYEWRCPPSLGGSRVDQTGV